MATVIALALVSSYSTLIVQGLAFVATSLVTYIHYASLNSLVKSPALNLRVRRLNESRDLQLESERDKLVAECRRLRQQCRELSEANELFRQENVRLRF